MLKFFKMTAAGNDFLLFDNRTGEAPATPAWVAAVCHRQLGAGADGVLLIENSRKGHFKARYFNADGAEADFCGNGMRCAARFAFLKVIAPREMRIETRRGVRRAEVFDTDVAVELDAPRGLRAGVSLLLKGKGVTGSYVRVEVPHFVVRVEDIERCDVGGVGAEIRRHPEFGAEGANVTFAEVADGHTLRLRTFERGIEGETLACGTGAACAASVAVHEKWCQFPVRCLTRSGGMLRIEPFPGEPGLRLVGPAEVVYAGELWDERFSSEIR